MPTRNILLQFVFYLTRARSEGIFHKQFFVGWTSAARFHTFTVLAEWRHSINDCRSSKMRRSHIATDVRFTVKSAWKGGNTSMTSHFLSTTLHRCWGRIVLLRHQVSMYVNSIGFFINPQLKVEGLLRRVLYVRAHGRTRLCATFFYQFYFNWRLV